MATLKEEKFLRVIAEDMRRLSGNVLTDKHFNMMDARLKRRSTDLGLKSLEEYYNHYMQNRAAEGEKILSLLTTHHTFFFREFESVLQLKSHLPALVEAAKNSGRSHINIWSSACSYGHEVYTLAMFLEKHLVKSHLQFDYRILASDIDIEAVETAKNGVYIKKALDKVPLEYSSGAWDKGKGNLANYVRIKKNIREKCQFRTHNLLQSDSSIGKFDLILVRNVLIYFDEDSVKKASDLLAEKLNDPGVLICGVSEFIKSSDEQVQKVSGPLYMKHSNAPAHILEKRPTATSVQEEKKLLSVVCVDDSRSVLSLLGKMLTKENGFEIVGTAADGVEAQSVVSQLKPDLVTLDIHMPRMTGLEYLQQMAKDHPPVLMISSASREDKNNALKALQLGASDYVEKPSLQNFKESMSEICLKLKSLASKSGHSASQRVELDEQFSTASFDTYRLAPKQRVGVYFGSEITDYESYLASVSIPRSNLLLVESKDTDSKLQKQSLQKEEIGVSSWGAAHGFEKGKASIVTAKEIPAMVRSGVEFVFLVLGDAKEFFNDVYPNLGPDARIILEDLAANKEWMSKVTYMVPKTSSTYHIRELFSKSREVA